MRATLNDYLKCSGRITISRLNRGQSSPIVVAVSANGVGTIVGENVVDDSGSAIIGLLHQAAEATKADFEHATQTAHQLAMQLRATEDRAEKLQEQVEQLEQQALQAENWLHRIHDEIENTFFRNRQERDRPESRQRTP